ncbi:conserved hypothetical protein [Leishmania mexicana MHOM/GT/2001/U1103]|uniref:Methyltransferase n=1 Tax=Leishmania mexicana (strain MHOM/GT/2001/U1103) TaxID=929439 RepID=E9AR47_LEIMU|nr:conserved hypothetical protein [Leishmania mexicana MHOM/GT/2001/U1103]CBZ25434.1 conserved hypothetical protein [Leishmania mexicana MHOM/GT/2001/U1103]
MLAWLVKEVESPYGDVATLHWAVPDADDNAEVNALNSTALQVELESAEDQLGAVLWNSNSAALRHLHTHVFNLPPSSSSSAALAPPAIPLAGKSIVELGAGVGCLGIALAMAGARVFITDLKELLPLIEHNVRLNEKRVQARSRGVGHCTAFQWKWGPTVSTMVHKQLQKAVAAVQIPDQQQRQHFPRSNATLSAKLALSHSVDRVVSSMVSSLLAPSAFLAKCEEALRSVAAVSSSTTAVATDTPLKTPFHYVILCDALYGNPKDWPALLYTLTELMATNPDECEIVNFCEQRVNDVEGAFLKLLDAENGKKFVPMENRQRDGDAMWTEVLDCATRCCKSSSTSAVEQHKQREEAANSLLSYVLVQRRGAYRWVYKTKVLQDAQSELNMVIRVTRIRWTCTEVVKGEKVTQHHSGGVGHHATTSSAIFGVPKPPRRRRSRDDSIGENGSAAATDAQAPSESVAPNVNKKKRRHGDVHHR